MSILLLFCRSSWGAQCSSIAGWGLGQGGARQVQSEAPVPSFVCSCSAAVGCWDEMVWCIPHHWWCFCGSHCRLNFSCLTALQDNAGFGQFFFNQQSLNYLMSWASMLVFERDMCSQSSARGFTNPSQKPAAAKGGRKSWVPTPLDSNGCCIVMPLNFGFSYTSHFCPSAVQHSI